MTYHLTSELCFTTHRNSIMELINTVCINKACAITNNYEYHADCLVEEVIIVNNNEFLITTITINNRLKFNLIN